MNITGQYNTKQISINGCKVALFIFLRLVIIYACGEVRVIFIVTRNTRP